MKVSTPGCVASQLKLLGERYAADTTSLHAQLQQLEVSKAAGSEQLRKMETVHALDGQRAAGSVVADARRALDESKREFAKQLDGNLAYAIAGTLNNVKPRELTSEQMSTFRFWVVNLVTFAAVLGAASSTPSPCGRTSGRSFVACSVGRRRPLTPRCRAWSALGSRAGVGRSIAP